MVATQNDASSTGTFPLPEPQLDRFLLSIRMELPSEEIQQRILLDHASGKINGKSANEPLIHPDEVLALQNEVRKIPLHDTVASYITSLCESLRRLAGNDSSVSVRASLAVMQAARAAAFLESAAAVHPDHVQHVFPAVLRPRLVPADGSDPLPLIRTVLDKTLVP